MNLISIIIAAYNEEKRLPQTVKKLKEELQSRQINYEIIVSSDGSTDKTLEIAKQMKLKAVGYKKNKGFSNALRYAFPFCQGDVILNLPSDIDDYSFLDHLDNFEQYDVISVSKRHPNSQIDGYDFKRWFVSNTYQKLNELIFGALIPTSDTHCVTIFKRKVLEKVYPYCKALHWGGETEAIVYAKLFDFKFIDVPIKLKHKTLSTNPFKEIRTFSRSFRELLEIKWRIRKVKQKLS